MEIPMIYVLLQNYINEQKRICDIYNILQYTNATDKQEKRLIEIYKNEYHLGIKAEEVEKEIGELKFDEKAFFDSYFLPM